MGVRAVKTALVTINNFVTIQLFSVMTDVNDVKGGPSRTPEAIKDRYTDKQSVGEVVASKSKASSSHPLASTMAFKRSRVLEAIKDRYPCDRLTNDHIRLFPLGFGESNIMSNKASSLPSLGQPVGEQSMLENRPLTWVGATCSMSRITNLFQLAMLVKVLGALVGITYLYYSPYHVGNYMDVWYNFFHSSMVRDSGGIHNAGRTLTYISVIRRNLGSPEIRKDGGDGGVIVVDILDSTNSDELTIESELALDEEDYTKDASLKKSSKLIQTSGVRSLVKLTEDNLADKNLINTKILHILSDEKVLIAAYSRIKSKGNMSPGADEGKETLDGISLEYFHKLSNDLRTGRFQFRPARRLEIPKPEARYLKRTKSATSCVKGGTRPLGVASPRDKIVQQAMLMVMEPIFEPTFSPYSHGFRPRRSCHTALRDIKRTFSVVNWFIEGDIKKCFDSFDHFLIIEEVGKRIRDKGFKDLLFKSLKAGYILGGQYNNTNIGTPQGSIISPILCNILMNKFDVFMRTLQKEFDTGNARKINPEYQRIRRQGRGKISNPTVIKENMKVIHQSNIPRLVLKDSGYKRLKYVRYADDFLIGVQGSYKDCELLRYRIAEYLREEVKLTLSLEKTKITHAQDGMVRFLGCDIRITPPNSRKILPYIRENKRFVMKAAGRPQILAPVNDILKRLERKGLGSGGQPSN